MQAAATRRAFSALASKIHPQLPLTPRESQQLLTLLTTSFRTHLDREYPVGTHEALPSTTTQLAKVEQASSGAPRGPSSYNTASEHIDSILSNPLFARSPQRRGSDSVAANVLKDPLGWFLDQVALGTADLSKAEACLDVLQTSRRRSDAQPASLSKNEKRPASVIAEWLHSSGQDRSRDFIGAKLNAKGMPCKSLANKLVPMLQAEDNDAPLWRWFAYNPEQRVQETGLDRTQVVAFRQRLLGHMVTAGRTRDDALTVVMRAYRMLELGEFGLDFKTIQGSISRLVDMIVANPRAPCTPELYETFAVSTRGWKSSWNRVVQAMLCLHHPTQPDAQPGLALLKDPKGAVQHVNSKKSRQRFLVQLCLGVARQLLEEEKFADAQTAMEFTKEHLAELVLSRYPLKNPRLDEQARIQEEKKNIAMLDRLLLT